MKMVDWEQDLPATEKTNPNSFFPFSSSRSLIVPLSSLPALSPLKHWNLIPITYLCPLTCDVPQGFLHGPLLFIIYTTPLSSLIKVASVDHHHMLTIPNYSPLSSKTNSFFQSVDNLLHVVIQNSFWMTSNPCLNPSKTEFIQFVSLRDQLEKIPDLSISLNLEYVSTNSPVRNLGMIYKHITILSRSCIMHIPDLRKSILNSSSKLHRQSLHL